MHQLHTLGVRPAAVWGSAMAVDLCRCLAPALLVVALVARQGEPMLSDARALAALATAFAAACAQTVALAYCLGHALTSAEFLATTFSSATFLATMILNTVVSTPLPFK